MTVVLCKKQVVPRDSIVYVIKSHRTDSNYKHGRTGRVFLYAIKCVHCKYI